MSSNRESLIFDPCGDVSLLLGRPEYGADHDNLSIVTSEVVNDDILGYNARADDVPADDVPADDVPADDVPADDVPADDVPADDAPADDAPADDAPAEDALVDDTPNGDAPEYQTEGSSAKSSIREVECRVSSRHLSLASEVFGHNFRGKSWELHSSTGQDLVIIPLLEDDFHAMVILLNIIHGLTRRVKRQVGIQVLLQTAVVINKYEFHEAAEVYTDMWLEHLRPTMPRHLHKDLAAWIYICWALGKPDEYTTLTKIAIHETESGAVDPGGLVPLPYWINDEIQSRRLQVLTDFLDILSRLLELYRGSSHLCRQNIDCDALALGKLERGLHRAELYPIPDPSSLGRSIDELFSTVRAIDLSPLCMEFPKKSRKSYRFSADYMSDEDGVFYHLDKELGDSISTLEDKLQGLAISANGHKGNT